MSVRYPLHLKYIIRLASNRKTFHQRTKEQFVVEGFFLL